jgi:imidazole glycerol phosphate synthase glutamine amidotransferase subunit
MITLLDAGSGSLHPLEGALDHLGFQHLRAATPAHSAAAGPLVLLGTGSFDQACAVLKQNGWWWELPQLAALGRPVLGIGLGMHLLAEGSEESPRGTGLGLIPGIVRSLGPGVKLPHDGWSPILQHRVHPSLPESAGAWLRFRHAHALEPGSLTLFTAEHGRTFSVLEMRGQTMGLQAHPEKSGSFGLVFLQKLLAGLGEAPTRGLGEGVN